MATIQKFNPPPGWPPAPEGWQPPPGWAPDPSWGPVPPGWPLWVRGRANPGAWGSAALSAAAWCVVLVGIGSSLSGRFSAEAIGEIIGRETMAGVITGWIAWTRKTRWTVWVYLLVVLGISLALTVVSTAGRTT